MIIVELDRDACLDVLSGSRVGRLAMTDGDLPYVVPISYAIEGDVLFSFTLPGRKLDLMRANPRVALLVERHHDDGTWHSVLAEGHVEELPDAVGSKREREQAVQALLHQADWWRPGALKPMVPPTTDNRDHIFFRIRIDRLSGRHAQLLPDE